MKTLYASDHVVVDREDKLAWVTFKRERCLNAVNNAANVQFGKAVKILREDSLSRVVVICGRGRAFSSGLDLKEYAAGKIGMEYYRRWDKALRILETMEKIIVVGMHGYCLGGALQLALACDIRVSTPTCWIGLPAIKESIIPGMGPWRLPKYVGMGWAKKLTLSGQNISGEQARAIGLVDYIVPEENFLQHLADKARKYLKTCSTGTRMSKLMLNRSFELNYKQAFALYLQLQERAHFSQDAREARAAYLEKRAPEWQ